MALGKWLPDTDMQRMGGAVKEAAGLLTSLLHQSRAVKVP